VALDGAGANSPYTKHLAQSISAPGLSIEETFKRTLKGVYQETKGEQTPWIASTFFGDFVFRPYGGTAPAASEPSVTAQGAERETVLVRPAPMPQTAEASPMALAGVYRVNGTNPNGSNYHGMLALTQDGDELRLVWWIGKQVFNGTGHFAGKMLVVNWGDKHPVIYSFGEGGALDGEWADGSATERLEPVAIAAPGDVLLSDGRYKVDGANPDGSRYSGTVKVTKQGERYRLEWQVGNTRYKGIGELAGKLLTVDWGSVTPVIYALAPDGSLKGLWDAGKGEETLTSEN
jgi:hypothetical protein